MTNNKPNDLRVVPVELLENIRAWLERANQNSDEDIEACLQLRAILAQPATAKVVMPERKREATEDSDIMIDCQNEGWNACLDEVVMLNKNN